MLWLWWGLLLLLLLRQLDLRLRSDGNLFFLGFRGTDVAAVPRFPWLVNLLLPCDLRLLVQR